MHSAVCGGCPVGLLIRGIDDRGGSSLLNQGRDVVAVPDVEGAPVNAGDSQGVTVEGCHDSCTCVSGLPGDLVPEEAAATDDEKIHCGHVSVSGPSRLAPRFALAWLKASGSTTPAGPKYHRFMYFSPSEPSASLL